MAGEMLSNLLRRDKGLDVTDVTSEPEEIASSKPHVAVISAELENDALKGFCLLKNLKSLSPGTRFIMLLDSPDRHLVVRSFRLGTRGIFCRCDALELLPKCVRRVHEQQIWANATLLNLLVNAVAEAPIADLVNAEGKALLSSREQQVVKFVAEGLSNREISRRLELSEHTIKNYVFRIFNKLGISSRVELVLYTTSQQVSAITQV